MNDLDAPRGVEIKAVTVHHGNEKALICSLLCALCFSLRSLRLCFEKAWRAALRLAHPYGSFHSLGCPNRT
jgi:hypothetical protein